MFTLARREELQKREFMEYKKIWIDTQNSLII